MLAGCAGFASVLPDLLDLDRIDSVPPIPQKLLVICGSINPITLRQLDEAQRAGAPRIQLTPEQKLDDRWLTSPDGLQITAEWMAQLKDAPLAIIEGNQTGEGDATQCCANRMGMNLEQVRAQISRTMGGVLERLLSLGLEATVLVTGGDTLLAFNAACAARQAHPSGRTGPWCVLSQIEYRRKKICHSLQVRGIRIGPPALGSERKIKLAEIRGGRGMLTKYNLKMPHEIFSGEDALENLKTILKKQQCKKK